VTLARADARFLLPRSVRSAVLIDSPPGWRVALAAAGVELAPAGGPDLAVASAGRAAEAATAGAAMVVLEGYAPWAAATLRRAGFAVAQYRAVPSLEHMELLLPLGRGAAPSYALRHRLAGARALKRGAGRLYGTLLSFGIVPPSRALITVGSGDSAPPRLVHAAARLGVDATGEWVVGLGANHVRSRSTFLVFPSGAQIPAWVVKFGRLAAARERFDSEERGFEIAARVGAVAAGCAPRLIGRYEVDGLPASVETAAVGEPLRAHLAGRRPRAAKLATVDAIAAWILSVATAPPRAPPDSELRYLERDVLPHWADRGASADLVGRVAGVPGAPVHGDLGVGNVLVRPDGFTAVDWEDAQPDGLPLSDLVDFLLSALIVVDRAAGPDVAEAKVRLLCGESDLSPTLFAWLRKAARALGLEPDAVSALVTLRILDVASSSRRFEEEAGERRSAETLPQERLAARWLSDPALGPNWDRWRREA
jgi:hypothetical protein